MKKLIIRLIMVLVILLVLAAVAVHLFLDGAIKRGVETIGPKVTKTDVKLNSVNLVLLSGSGKIKGLVIGNPEGFKMPSAIAVGSTAISLKPASLLEEKVVVRSINIQAPEITFETGLNVLENNLSKLLANVEETTASGAEPTTSSGKPAKKLQVDEFVLSGAKLRVSVAALAGKSATVPLPEIRLKDLGQGPEGITVAELTKEALEAILAQAIPAAKTAVEDLMKGAVYMTKEMGTNAVEKATKGIGDLFKKKQ